MRGQAGIAVAEIVRDSARLLRSKGHLLSKDELMLQVWPDSFVEEANITVNISALRKALGEVPDGVQYIENGAQARIAVRCPVLSREARLVSYR